MANGAGTGYRNGDGLEGPSRVVIEFHSSSTKAGQEAYRVVVTADATEADVDEAARLASRARQKALAELAKMQAENSTALPEHGGPEATARGGNGSDASQPRCKDCDSPMTYREGQSKTNGRKYAGWFCPAADPGLPGHEPVWTKPRGQQQRKAS